ncbi:MAG TPA: serine protease [Terriglobales bacterium]|nr:serine protease [Terriglobales bacterium]
MTPAVQRASEHAGKAARGYAPWAAMTGVTVLLALVAGGSQMAAERSAQRFAQRVERLSAELEAVRQEQAMPAVVLNRHRDSIGFLYGTYTFSGRPAVVGRRGKLRMRFSGTGFVVGAGLIATNRHVAEPWFEDEQAEALMRRGARPKLERLEAFFPGVGEGLRVTKVTVSDEADLAVVSFEPQASAANLRALPLAARPAVPGDPVVVVGYPMGTAAMVAKSPRAVYRRLVNREDEMAVTRELASLLLIRPSATFGHLGDVVGHNLIYDAATAHGGSGGPVFNARGEVIGINAAYLEGFSGSTLGVSVEALRPLMQEALSGLQGDERAYSMR